MKIWIAKIDHYEELPIEALADKIHPMAAVAWDRDMADVVLAEDPAGALPVLRFCNGYNKTWAAFSGKMGKVVAWWDKVHLRWVSSVADIGWGEGPYIKIDHNPAFDLELLKRRL